MSLKIKLSEPQPIDHPAVREPSLFKLANGDLLLTYHVQADTHFAERHGLRSKDGGKTWLAEPRRSHREQAMGQSKDGVVYAADIYTFEITPGRYLGSYYRSDDAGLTFTGPHETTIHTNRYLAQEYPTVEHFPTADHPLAHFYQPLPAYYQPLVDKASRRKGPTFWRYIVEDHGRWLTTFYGKWHADNAYRTVLMTSEDQGKTWHDAGTMAYEHCCPGDGYCEPVMVKVADGSLLCVIRRGGGQPLGQVRSTDGGKSWSEPELLTAHGVDPDLYLMSNGILACTYGRPGRHIMFSASGNGDDWSNHTPIGDWAGSSYMGIAEVEPGKLLVICDHAKAKRDVSQCFLSSMIVEVSR